MTRPGESGPLVRPFSQRRIPPETPDRIICARRSDDTDARKATVRRFGRSDRSAQRHPWLLRSIRPTRARRPPDASVDQTETRCGESGAGYLRAPGGVPHRPRPPLVRPIGPATRSGGRRAEYPAPSRHRLAETTEDRLAAPTSGGPDRTVRFSVVHGLHDEACHCGEILLLRKMQGLGRPPRGSGGASG
jgi:hypothetical protein